MQRLKDDESRLIHAIRVGTAASVRLSPERRVALLKKFERRGWVRDGKLTSEGERQVKRTPQPAVEERQAKIEKATELLDAGAATVEEVVAGVLEERQSDGDISGPEGEGVDDQSRRSTREAHRRRNWRKTD